MRIRSVTLHVIVEDWFDAGHIAAVLDKATRAIKGVAERIARYSGFKVWTRRVALPPIPPRAEAYEALVEALRRAKLDGETLYSVYHVDAYSASVENIRKLLEISPNLYASVAAEEADEKSAGLLYELARLPAEEAVRVAMTVPSHLETPYFPAAVTLSSAPGVSIALLYPSLLRGKEPSEALVDLLEAIDRIENAVAQTVSEEGWIDFYGFDLSLSPWMEDSVAELVEKLAGDRLGSPGTMAAIASLEDLIAEACEETLCTGFNQVMLPVAEDNTLKARAAEGSLRLRDLAMYTYACVAGVDMAFVPSESWTPRTVHGILSDLAAASHRKQAVVAARLAAVNAKPGDRIRLARFGETPVIKV